MDKKKLQKAAGRACDFLRSSQNIDLPYNTALELVSLVLGYKNLHQAQAETSQKDEGKPSIEFISIDEALALIDEATAVVVDCDELVYPELPDDGDEDEDVALRLDTPLYGMKTFLRKDNLTVRKEGPFLFLKDTRTPDETYQLTLLVPLDTPPPAQSRFTPPSSETGEATADMAQQVMASALLKAYASLEDDLREANMRTLKLERSIPYLSNKGDSHAEIVSVAINDADKFVLLDNCDKEMDFTDLSFEVLRNVLAVVRGIS